MIKTKRVASLAAYTSKFPPSYVAREAKERKRVYVNVLTWHDAGHPHGSKWHVFSPYYLKTDGLERQVNDGGVLFENFWQGSKVWPTMYDCEVWAHQNLRGIAKHLWFEYRCDGGLGYEHHFADGEIQHHNYLRWREAMFKCNKPVRYPNGYKRKDQVAFSLLIDKDSGRNERLDYIEARKRIYVAEYGRLVRKLPEYSQLLALLKEGKTLVICEVDVPDNCDITLDKLALMLEDKSIRFGHGLCLAYELLNDLKTPSPPKSSQDRQPE